MSAVYLIHFDKPYRHAQHYIGWTAESVRDRFDRHTAGNGANLCRVVAEAGIGLQLVKVWQDVPRKFERELKARGSGKRICPLCKPAYNAGRRQKSHVQ